MSESANQSSINPRTSKPRYANTWKTTVVRRAGWKSEARTKARKWMLDVKSFLAKDTQTSFARCLACHYVFDDQRKDFEALLKRLRNQGDFINTDTLQDIVRGDRQIDGRYFHLSFDDGFKNVIENALPILAEQDVPMILFVPSFWVGADWENARRYSVEIAEYRDVVQMATWDDLRQLVADGFEIGSHTRTHARLSNLSADTEVLRRELVQSKIEIETQLGCPCRYIAYPYGKPGDYDELTLAETKAAGYELGFGIHRGSVNAGTNSLLVPRHHFEPEWPVHHISYFAKGKMEDYWDHKIILAGVGINHLENDEHDE